MANEICCYMIVQDEQDMIAYSITNPLLMFEKVVVVDGGSTDNTKNIIKETAKKLNMEHKLFLYDRPFTTLNDQRNYALSKCDKDFIIYLDADELMEINEIEKIKNDYIYKYDLILIRSYHLYLDFWMEAVSPGWLNSWKMPRIFRRVNGLHYTNYVAGEGDHTLYVGKNYFMDFFRKKIICEKNDISIKHYGHCQGREHEHNKIVWFMKYDKPELRKLSEEELSNRAWQSSYFDSRFWIDHINCDPIGIIKFTGQHPEIMKQHPLYNAKVIND